MTDAYWTQKGVGMCKIRAKMTGKGEDIHKFTMKSKCTIPICLWNVAVFIII